ncbi:MAG: prepilin-type N-terminal cleavage/methylation domain-containing protein [Coprobacillaceae bacterium]
MVKNNKGFTLVEVLFSLSITLLILFSVVGIVSLTISKDTLEVMNANIEIGVKSLSQDLYTASEFRYGKELSYIDSDERVNTISLHNQRVVREPGFVIYMHDIDDINFYLVNDKIYLKITTNEINKTFLIGIDDSVNEE